MARWDQEKLEPSQERSLLAVSHGKSFLAAEEEKKKDISNKLKAWFLTAKKKCLPKKQQQLWGWVLESELPASLRVSDSSSVLITEITEDKGALQLRDTEQCSSLNVAVSHGVLIACTKLSLPFLVVDLFLKAPLHTLCIHAASPAGDTNPREIESMQLWKAFLNWVRETQAGPEINIIELEKWKLEIHIADVLIFPLKCISSTDDPNPLTFISSWKCCPNAGQAGGQFSYPLYIVHIIDIFVICACF